MKKIIMVLVICLTTFSLQAKDKAVKGAYPKNMVIISQSSESDQTMISAVDLENNELVLLEFMNGRVICFRTGITIDMSKQKAIEGTSSSSDDE